MRKTKTIVLGPEAGRDKGKHWFIEEMPALRAERWARRVAFHIGGNAPLTDTVESGIGVIAVVGINAIGRIPLADQDELLDELMRCVKRIPDPAKPDFRANWIEDDFEEIATITKLRWEAFKIHTDFFTVAAPFLASIGQILFKKLLDMKTSLEQSGQSSGQDSQL